MPFLAFANKKCFKCFKKLSGLPSSGEFCIKTNTSVLRLWCYATLCLSPLIWDQIWLWLMTDHQVLPRISLRMGSLTLELWGSVLDGFLGNRQWNAELCMEGFGGNVLRRNACQEIQRAELGRRRNWSIIRVQLSHQSISGSRPESVIYEVNCKMKVSLLFQSR